MLPDCPQLRKPVSQSIYRLYINSRFWMNATIYPVAMLVVFNANVAARARNVLVSVTLASPYIGKLVLKAQTKHNL